MAKDPGKSPSEEPTQGNAAVNEVVQAVYEKLHALAKECMKDEPAGHILQTTAVVHEAYIRLVQQRKSDWNDAAHFVSIAAMTIRRILVEHARAAQTAKRGGRARRVSLDGLQVQDLSPSIDILALDEALTDLAALDARQAEVVERRHLLGMTVNDTAQVLGVSPRTVNDDWNFARAWLQARLREEK